MKTQPDDAQEESVELQEHYDFDYDKAKPNRFAARLIKQPTVVMLDLDTTPCPSN